MSFTYITNIKSSAGVTVDSNVTDDMSQAVQWANNTAIDGDLVVVSEAYRGADGVLEPHDHVNSSYV